MMRTRVVIDAIRRRSSQRWPIPWLRLARRNLRSAQFIDLNLQELFERLLLLRRNRVEEDRGTEDVLRTFVAAAHLHHRAENLTRDVEPAVTREDQRARAARLHRRAMNDRRAIHTEIDQLAVDVRQLNGNRRGRYALRFAAFFSGHCRWDYTEVTSATARLHRVQATPREERASLDRTPDR